LEKVRNAKKVPDAEKAEKLHYLKEYNAETIARLFGEEENEVENG
jgi:hypothetical protein